ncbi:GPALPP motifs-containing protein 1 isoform X2 [Cherax quadricarinatus]|uniref:GPALPP motifs-containing protein 1 isoform X2 n=1 Tax=Cherax quadricarinatus TaxID=27406 RepID=UPI002379EBC5|nr:GPALPP motifs-containing protein 1-like isoform X2 [Cherax quadricarinatus]
MLSVALINPTTTTSVELAVKEQLKMSTSDSDSEAYGPPLPPSIRSESVKKERADVKPQANEENMDEDAFLPELPPHLIGKRGGSVNQSASSNDQKLSHNLQNQNLKRTGEISCDNPARKTLKQNLEQKPASESDDDESNVYGAALPPHLLNKKREESSQSDRRHVLGPTLPKGYVPPREVPLIDSDRGENSDIEDDVGPTIGPLPSAVEIDENEYRIRQFELRAQRMKDKIVGKNIDNKPLVRESWMTELPEDKPNFCGLGPRQFLRKTPQAKRDCSGWTDTPADKARKAELGIKEEQPVITPEDIASNQRDKELLEKVKEYNSSKRAEPLIDLHKKKIKEKEAKSRSKERRPFSREEDLHVNKFDDAQKSNILKKAQQLNDRFSSGDRKFL